ncbi:alpha/beta-hydrolase [Dichomitus squalens]|uniref:Alpha/beta-hydrolase n=1 Tax=Dichomitus squalens TaxID=114155 RepID=A0A4Q9PT53_9APHY|nr:alpha/beta-hydrolase [Dichomitus squalens]
MVFLHDAFMAAGFEAQLIPIPPPTHDPTLSVQIYALSFKSPTRSTKEPLLLVHGHPQNSIIYRHLGPALARSSGRDIVIADTRGSGQSTAPRVRNLSQEGEGGQLPSEDALRLRYSKREVGKDLVHVMKHLGYDKFSVIGHDRGARIAHRMADDWPDAVVKVMLLDIAPTYDLISRADAQVALTFWHWFFLPQPYPFPESMVLANPSAYLNRLTSRFVALDKRVFPDDVVKTYLQQLSSPDHVHAICEDYRSSGPGGIDLEHDAEDRTAGRKVKQPVRVLWGKRGPNERLFGHDGMLELWRNVCEDVDGRAVDCGHYIPEENPEDVEREALAFF